MRSLPFRQIGFALGALGLVLVTGCSSLTETSPISAVGELARAKPVPEHRSYSWVFTNSATEAEFRPLVPRVDAALADLGYVAVPYGEATLLLYVVAERDRLVRERREMTAAEAGLAMNPDSIRYKNVAAMMGGGRYNQLLNDHPNAPGEIILGPEGELIATGDLRPLPDVGARPEKEVTRRVSRLRISAVDADPARRENPGLEAATVAARWWLEVEANVAVDEEVPSIALLVETALQRLAEAP